MRMYSPAAYTNALIIIVSMYRAHQRLARMVNAPTVSRYIEPKTSASPVEGMYLKAATSSDDGYIMKIELATYDFAGLNERSPFRWVQPTQH